MEARPVGAAAREMVCFDCGTARADGDRCPAHPEGPLLDPSDPEVLLELRKEEDRERDMFYRRWELPCFVLGLLLGAALDILGYVINPDLEWTWVRCATFLSVGAAAGFALGRTLAKLRFRPKFARWTRGSTVAKR